MKRIFLGIILSLFLVITTFAKTEQVILDEQVINLEVQEKNGRRLYPLRAICNALGIQIVAVDRGKIQLQQGDNVVYYFVDQKLVANDTGYFNTDVAAMSTNNTVYVPIKTIGTMFGYHMRTVDGGITLNKLVNFTRPKATYASNLLMQDLTVAEDIVETIDPQYYLSALNKAISGLNWRYISECKEYILDDHLTISEMSGDLKTQSGKAVYNAGVAFLDNVYEAFDCIAAWDFDGVSEAAPRIATAASQLMNKREALVNAIYKVSGSI